MQLHRLEVEGFGPFRARQTVDFDAFTDDGIFLIQGRTGAGKSSILDAVCFGLYGGVPRYEGGEKRLRSDHCAPDDLTEVLVEFSTPRGRYRVRRSPDYERPKKRGGGTTVQAAAVQLDMFVGGDWIGLAAREREAAHELDEILQLSREQFLQVILLAQNRFSEFLLAGSKERQALLRRLFGTERFEDVQARFDDRRRAAERALASRLATVSARIDEAERLAAAADVLRDDEQHDDDTDLPRPSTTEERLAILARARARAAYRTERRDAERTEAQRASAAADDALSALREERRAQVERDRSRQALVELDREAPLIESVRRELADARAAESLRGLLTSVARARSAYAESVADEQRAREEGYARGIDRAADPDALAAEVAELTRRIGAWQQAAELESTLPSLDAAEKEAVDSVDAGVVALAAVDAERDTLPAAKEQLLAERDAARRESDRVSDLDAARALAVNRLSAAEQLRTLTEERSRADEVLAEASGRLSTAQSSLAELRRRRLDGFAGELAAGLDDGPCPVCGSHEHPAPAEHADPVSADDVDAAESARDAAAAREREAAEKVSLLRARIAAATATAEGRSTAEAEAELADVEERLARGRAASTLVSELQERIDDIGTRIDRLDADRENAARALAAAREALALATQRRADARSAVDAARGDHASVAHRLTEALQRIEAATRIVDTAAERSRRSAALDQASADLDDALATSDFDDITSAETALRSASEQATLESRVTRHAVQREKERAILFDLELRTLPEDPIDLTSAETSAREARERWSRAVDEASRSAALLDQLTSLIDGAAAEHASSAGDAAEFETLRGLADALAGRGANTRKMTLETFVLAAELEEIVDAANRRLADMSSGRYQLRHSDALAARGAASGLGIVVFDAFTGQTRPAQSLSGGETFLSSLALALGLAEVVTARAGGIRLDTLFIDEGFGSLDGDTLDVAMRTLDELRQGGRTVGVISHVEAMQEQIPAQLSVRATADGPSVIEMR